MNRSKNANQEGKSLIEFALIIPFLFFLVFGGVESFRMVSTIEVLSTLAHEVGNASFRNCIGMEERTSTDICLEETVNEIKPVIDQALPGAQVIVRLFRHNSSSGGDDGSHTVDISIAESKYSRAEASNLHSYTQEKEGLVTIEVFYPFQSILSVAALKRDFYETAVY